MRFIPARAKNGDMIHLILAAMLPSLLCACDAAPAPESSKAGSASAFPLAGRWTISRIDNELSARIPLTAGDGQIFWEPSCAGFSLFYSRQGNAVTFRAPGWEGQRTVCLPGVPDGLMKVMQGLEGRWSANVAGAGDIILRNAAGEQITLEEPRPRLEGDLSGEWRVAGLDGEALDLPHGIALSADESAIWWERRCALANISYRIVEDRFVVVDHPAPPPAPPDPPGKPPEPAPPDCAVKPPPGVAEIASAIREAKKIERTLQNGIRLTGGGRSVTLFRQ